MSELDADHDGLYPEMDVDEEEAREAPPAPFWTVAIYLVDRAYGGPEEGGWWFDCGERQDTAFDDVLVPSDLLSVAYDEDEACRRAKALQERLDMTVNVGRRDIGSVLSTGRYYAEVYNGHPPQHFPERRPHYE